MKNWFGPAALAMCLAIPGGMMAAKAHAAAPAIAAAASVQDRDDWDRPPDGYSDAQRMGFHDGIQAARRDFDGRRHMDADDHRMYKHPPVDRDDRGAYREGFRHGYSAAMHHMKGEYRDRDEHPY